MRKLLILLVFIISISFTGKAQIIADGNYTTVGPIWRAHFSYYGHKFVNIPPNSTQINLLNTDMTLWKTININIPPYNKIGIAHISDKLIDTDTLIEVVANMSIGNTNTSHAYIVNENSDILYDFGSVTIINLPPPEIVWIDGQYKMIAVHNITGNYNYEFIAHVLPMQGYLPCENCINDTTGVDTTLSFKETGMQQQTGSILVADAVPNPSNGTVSIGYHLPKNAKSGELVIYNTNGQESKRITVKSNDTKVQVDNKDLPSGVYYYYIYSDGKRSQGNKMVVTH